MYVLSSVLDRHFNWVDFFVLLLCSYSLLFILIVSSHFSYRTPLPLVAGCLCPNIRFTEFKNTKTVPKQAFNYATDSVDATHDWADANKEWWDRLQTHGILDPNRRQLVPKENGGHASFNLNGLRRSELEGLEGLWRVAARLVIARCLVHVVNLTDLEEVINE